MEINEIFGLPAHPLFVHVPVVLIPLAFIGSLLLLKASWRRYFAIPVAVLAVVGAGAVFLAVGSGEQLEERVKETELVEDHSQAGEQAEPFAVVFALLAVGVAVVDQVQRRQGGGTGTTGEAGATTDPAATTASAGSSSLLVKAVPVLTVLTILSGAVASYMVYEAGHSGAKATWDNLPASAEGGEGGEG